MKKSILNLGNPLNKVQLKQINGSNEPCPSTNCYFGPPDPLMGDAIHCGSCQDYNSLPQECKGRVLVSYECFPM